MVLQDRLAFLRVGSDGLRMDLDRSGFPVDLDICLFELEEKK